MKNTFRLTLLAASMGAMFTSVHAQAQTDDSTVLKPVVVTAQKRSQSLQEVPISMTVLDEAALEKSHVRSLYDIAQSAPNFEVVRSPGWGTVNVRGVGGGGRSIGWDTRVGVYLDGVYLGQVQALDQSLADIDQIEILRGPQGHLFGRNTDAGAVNITTRAPSKTFEGSIGLDVGNFNSREISAYLSGPLSASTQGKISISTENRDGTVTNLFNGQKVNDLDRTGVRGQLAIQATRELKIDLYADYSKINQDLIMGEPITGMRSAPLPGGPLPHNQVNFSFTPFRNSELSGVSASVNYDLGSGYKLTSVTGYRDTKQSRGNDLDYSALDLASLVYTDHFKQTSEELRIASPNTGAVRYVAGVYLLSEEASTNRAVTAGVAGPALAMQPGWQVTNSGTIKTKDYAVFGNVDYDIASNLTLNLGLRYTHEKKDLVYNLDGSHSGAFRISTLSGYTDSRSDSKLTPTLGLNFAASKDTNIYAKYSTGFKSGGWNTDFLNVLQVAGGLRFNTESVKSFELGLKGKAMGGRMQYDVAAFSSKFTDYQLFQLQVFGANSALVLTNAGKVDTSGVESSMRWRVSRDLTLGANLALVHAVYKQFPNGGGVGVDYAGHRVSDTPQTTAALNATYAISGPGGRFEIAGDVSYRSSTVLDGIFADLPSRTLVNGRLAYFPTNSNWSGSLWVRNLANSNYVVARGQDFLGNQFDTHGLPRMFGINAKYSF